MNHNTLATAFLAIGWITVSLILVVVEPRMGFTGPADYLTLDKVLVGAESVGWLLGDLIYVGFFVALCHLALQTEDSIERSAGLGAGMLFLVVASIGRVLAYLPGLELSPGDVSLLVVSLLPVRLAVLRATVVILGIFAWRTTLPNAAHPSASIAARMMGLVVLFGSIGFFFVFLPLPLAFTVWAIWLFFRRRRDA